MSKSSLTQIVVPAHEGNYTKGRSGRSIEAITIHHMAGRLTAEQCGKIFQTKGRCGSSHYGVGYEGSVANYVDEEDTAWTNSNWDSNCKSVTIETSNDVIGGNWHVSDASLNSLIKLVADIAKRNNLGTLVKGKNLTWHSMFANTSCPGPYLLSKIDYIVKEANRINSDIPTPTPSNKHKIGDKVTINGIYTSSSSDKKLTPARNTGTITYILSGAKNPYLLDEGNLGWVNDACIVSTPTPTPSNKQYLNLFPSVDSWKVYKTHNYFNPNNESDILAILNPAKFGGLSYEILKDYEDYHFKIKTQQFGIGYIAGNPNKYPCSITNKAEY